MARVRCQELDGTYDKIIKAIKDNRKQPERLPMMSGGMSEDIENIIGVIKPTVDAIALLRDELVIPTDMNKRIDAFERRSRTSSCGWRSCTSTGRLPRRREGLSGTSDLGWRVRSQRTCRPS